MMETSANAFLNWVRDGERPTFVDAAGEAQAAGWRNFFTANIGMFLRNATFNNYGNVTFFQSQGSIPPNAILFGPRVSGFAVRLTPFISQDNPLGFTEELLTETNVAVYGWSDVSTNVEIPYWLLVADKEDRLVWVAAGGVNHATSELTPGNKISNVDLFSPIRPSNQADLNFILGV